MSQSKIFHTHHDHVITVDILKKIIEIFFLLTLIYLNNI